MAYGYPYDYTTLFLSGSHMYEKLRLGVDLYNPDLEKYVFCYNEEGAICVYDMDIEAFYELRNEAEHKHEKISSLLGCGGHVLDDTRFDAVTEYKNYIKPAYDFCNETYQQRKWIQINY